MSKEPREVKIVVLGAFNTGRRALIRKYVDSIFTEHYEPFDNSAAHKHINVDGEPYHVQIFFADLKSHTKIELGDAFILLYAVNDRGSFIGTRDLYQLLQQTRAKSARAQSPIPVSSTSVPIYLVGSKIDLENERQVSLEEAKNLAIELQCRKLFEISSKTHTGEVDDLFTKLIRELPRSQQEQTQQQQQQQQTPPQPQLQQHQQQQVQTQPQQQRSAYQQQLYNSEAAAIAPQGFVNTRPGTMSSQAQMSTTSPSTSPRKGSMLDRFKFGSLRRTPSNQSMRKKSDSFGETMRRINSRSSSRDNLRSTSRSVPALSTTRTVNGSTNGNYGTATRTNSSPYRLDVDTSAWRETVKWPSEIIAEEELRR